MIERSVVLSLKKLCGDFQKLACLYGFSTLLTNHLSNLEARVIQRCASIKSLSDSEGTLVSNH
jgi:hypothetical protein